MKSILSLIKIADSVPIVMHSLPRGLENLGPLTEDVIDIFQYNLNNDCLRLRDLVNRAALEESFQPEAFNRDAFIAAVFIPTLRIIADNEGQSILPYLPWQEVFFNDNLNEDQKTLLYRDMRADVNRRAQYYASRACPEEID